VKHGRTYMLSISAEFKITFDISDSVIKTRKRISVESTVSWYRLRNELAKGFNVHPDALRAQYRLSSEKESAFPFGLNNADDLQVLIDHLRPLSVPTVKKKARSKQPPIVNVFNSDSNAPITGSNPTKGGKVCNSSCLISTVIMGYIL
jgi:hypothetical protein